MERDLKTLSKDINPDDDAIVDHYVNKTPKQKSSKSNLLVIGIVISIIVIIVGIILFCFFCRSDEEKEGVRREDSDTSIAS